MKIDKGTEIGAVDSKGQPLCIGDSVEFNYDGQNGTIVGQLVWSAPMGAVLIVYNTGRYDIDFAYEIGFDAVRKV
jgi:hypothetical protein